MTKASSCKQVADDIIEDVQELTDFKDRRFIFIGEGGPSGSPNFSHGTMKFRKISYVHIHLGTCPCKDKAAER